MILSLSHLHALYSSDSSDALYSTSFSLLCLCVFSATLSRPGLLLYPGGGAEVISSLCCLPAKKLGSAVLLPLSKRTICFSTGHGVVSPPQPCPSRPQKLLELSCSLVRRCPAS